MKEIPLTHGRVALVDDTDWLTLSRQNWRYCCVNGKDYAWERYAHGAVSMHRVVLGAKPGEHVDHINGDGLDNRRSNIRICTHAQNMKNRAMHRDNTSGYRGVYPDGRRQYYEAWCVQIRSDNKKYCKSGFRTAKEAAKEYDRLAKALPHERRAA